MKKYEQIVSELRNMTEDDHDELGAMIWSEFFDDELDAPETFSEDDVMAMLRQLQVRFEGDALDLEEAFDVIDDMIGDLLGDDVNRRCLTEFWR